MIKVLAIATLLGLLLFDCGKRNTPRPIPAPTPIPTPISSPSPSPIESPTISPTPIASPETSPIPISVPKPTPVVDFSTFNFKRATNYTKVSAVDGLLSKFVNQAMLDSTIEGVEIIGGGSITEPIVLSKPTKFDSSTYSCDITNITITKFLEEYPNKDLTAILKNTPVTNYGCFIIADNVFVEGTYKIPQTLMDYFRLSNKNNINDPYLKAVQELKDFGAGTTILEPEFFIETPSVTHPSIEVFQAMGDVCCSHTEKAKNISITGFKIKGRQTKYDGGIRASILLGNIENGFVSDIYLEDTASIGITLGGSALEKNNFAKNVVATRIIASGVAAANIALINIEDVYVFENYFLRLGHHNPKFGGGVSGVDLETNSPADHSKNIWIYNNLADFEGSFQISAGTAFLAQDPYLGVNHGRVNIINNVAIGGRNLPVASFMSNGIFLNGLTDCYIGGNYIYKTGQNAIQAYAIKKCIIEDNIFDSTGGGGNPSFHSDGMQESIIRRNNYIFGTGIPTWNVEPGFMDKCGANNSFENNIIPGVSNNAPSTKRCP